MSVDSVRTLNRIGKSNKIKNVGVVLRIDESVRPVRQLYRRVPALLERAVKLKLKGLRESGLPYSITLDNARQFLADMICDYCRGYHTFWDHTIPYWPQENGKAEHQNKSMIKRLKISRAESRDWKMDLLDFLLKYCSTSLSTTGRAPAELMFDRVTKDKLPQIGQPLIMDEEIRDNDKIMKAKGEEYAGGKRGARENSVEKDDLAVVRENKLSPNFSQDECEVLARSGSEVLVKAGSGGVYQGNGAHVKRIASPRRSARRSRKPARFGDGTVG